MLEGQLGEGKPKVVVVVPVVVPVGVREGAAAAAAAAAPVLSNPRRRMFKRRAPLQPVEPRRTTVAHPLPRPLRAFRQETGTVVQTESSKLLIVVYAVARVVVSLATATRLAAMAAAWRTRKSPRSSSPRSSQWETRRHFCPAASVGNPEACNHERRVRQGPPQQRRRRRPPLPLSPLPALPPPPPPPRPALRSVGQPPPSPSAAAHRRLVTL
jgi:hypothetical protein